MTFIIGEPYATWIHLGIKTALITPTPVADLVGKKIPITGSREYGYIEVTDIRPMSMAGLRQKRNTHRISERVMAVRQKTSEEWNRKQLYLVYFKYTPNNIIEKEFIEPGDVVMKPSGPWGDGFPECIAYTKRKNPKWSTERARKYCGAIHQRQQANKAAPIFTDQDIEEIDHTFTAALSDDHLLELYKTLHVFGLQIEGATQANAAVLTEFMNRDIKVEKIRDELEKASDWWNAEHIDPLHYPIRRRDLLDALPDLEAKKTIWDDPFKVQLLGPLVTHGKITGQQITINLPGGPNKRLERAIIHGVTKNKIRERIEFTYDTAPMEPYINLFSEDTTYKYNSYPDSYIKYVDIHCAYHDWVAPRLTEKVLVTPIIKGEEMQIHIRNGYGQKHVHADISPLCQDIVNELSRAGNRQLIANAVQVDDGFIITRVIEVNGRRLPENNGLNWNDTRTFFKATPHARLLETWIVSNKPGFEDAVYKSRKAENSVGAKVLETGTMDMIEIDNHKTLILKAIGGGLYSGPLTPHQRRQRWRKGHVTEYDGKHWLQVTANHTGLDDGTNVEVNYFEVRYHENKEHGDLIQVLDLPSPGSLISNRRVTQVDNVRKMAKYGTAHQATNPETIRLQICPNVNDPDMCPLTNMLDVVEDKDGNLEVKWKNEAVDECKLSTCYRCPHIKPCFYETQKVK